MIYSVLKCSHNELLIIESVILFNKSIAFLGFSKIYAEHMLVSYSVYIHYMVVLLLSCQKGTMQEVCILEQCHIHCIVLWSRRAQSDFLLKHSSVKQHEVTGE